MYSFPWTGCTAMTTTTKRANFDLSPEQDEMLVNLRAQLSASSTKEAVLRAVQLITLLLDEVQQGNRLFVGKSPYYRGPAINPGTRVSRTRTMALPRRASPSLAATALGQGAQAVGIGCMARRID